MTEGRYINWKRIRLFSGYDHVWVPTLLTSAALKDNLLLGIGWGCGAATAFTEVKECSWRSCDVAALMDTARHVGLLNKIRQINSCIKDKI